MIAPPCLCTKHLLSDAAGKNTRPERPMKHAVKVMAAVESVGVPCKVLAEISGFYAMEGSGDPGFGVFQEPKDVRQPCFERLLLAVHDPKLRIKVLNRPQRVATVGVYQCSGRA